MTEELRELFDRNQNYVELQLETERSVIDAVYASDEQVYVIASPMTEEELAERWSRVAETVAVEVQSRMDGHLFDLRWELYLLYPVLSPRVPSGLVKTIENNRRFFRKIVVSEKDKPYKSRLPLFLELAEDRTEILFRDFDFLQELQGCLGETAQQLGADFFANGVQTADDLVQKFKGGATSNEGSGA